MRFQINKDILQDLLDNSSNYAEIMDKLGGARSGASYRVLKRRIATMGCDTTKFDINFQLWKADSARSICKKDPNPFRYGSKVGNQRLKKILIKEGVTDECSECGQLPEWNGKPLVLQLDHIDGDSKNSVRGNLRILCPNCHTQTSTFGTKNRIKINKDKYDISFNVKNYTLCKCGGKMHISSKVCLSCQAFLDRKVPNRPSLEQLEKDLETMSYVAVGKKYGVSDNCIRKWLKAYQK
jgi:hypothetical protein